MPVYQYQGKSYELSETDPAAARARIQSFLSKPQTTPATTPMGEATGFEQPVPPGPPSDMSFQKGMAKAASMTPLGVFGDIEAGFRQLPSVTKISKEPVLPTTEKLTSAVYGKPRTEAEAGGRSVGEVIGIPGAGYAVSGLGKLASIPQLGIVSRALGTPAREGASALRQKALGELRQPAEASEKTLADLQAAQKAASEEVTRQQQLAARSRQQISRQPEVAGQRRQEIDVGRRERVPVPRTPEQKAAAQSAILQAQLRLPVQERVGAERARLAQTASELERSKEGVVQSSLDQLSKQKNVLAEDVGGLIQPLGRQNVQSLAATRTEEAITKVKDPAFERALEREAAGDFLITNPKSQKPMQQAIDLLEKQIAGTTEPYRGQLKARLESLRGERLPLTAAEARVEQLRASSIPGYTPRTEKVQPMTLQQAEFMRRMLTDKQLAESSGFAALDIGRRNEAAKLVSQAMKEYEPQVGEYLAKYREKSAPIEKATAGRGAALTEADLLAEQEVLFAADKKAVANYYLDGSQERAERLLSLVGGKNPQVIDSIKGFFRSQMEGMSAKQASDFVSKNEGLLRVFPEIKPQIEGVAQAKSFAETAPKAAAEKAKAAEARLGTATSRLGEALGTARKPTERPSQSLAGALARVEKPVTRAEKTATEAGKAVTQQQNVVSSLKSLQTELETARNPKEVAAAVDKTASKLVELNIIDEAYRKSLVTEINALKDTLEAQATARKQLGALAAFAGVGYAGRGVISSAIGGQ